MENISPGSLEPPDLHAAQRAKRLGSAAQAADAADKAHTWTNTAGRSIQARFLRVEGANVLLRMDGKEIPVPLSTLSAASLQQAQPLEQERARQ